MALQTARVTLDVTFDNEVTEHPANWDWANLVVSEPGESVSVVESD